VNARFSCSCATIPEEAGLSGDVGVAMQSELSQNQSGRIWCRNSSGSAEFVPKLKLSCSAPKWVVQTLEVCGKWSGWKLEISCSSRSEMGETARGATSASSGEAVMIK
jgi:hypothetical protein